MVIHAPPQNTCPEAAELIHSAIPFLINNYSIFLYLWDTVKYNSNKSRVYLYHRYIFISFSKELNEKSISEVQGSESVSPPTLQTFLQAYWLTGLQQINSITFTYPHWL